MVILEIVIGSEFVLQAKNNEQVMWLLHHSQAYIDKELHDMLEEMLVDGYFGKATAFLASGASVTTGNLNSDQAGGASTTSRQGMAARLNHAQAGHQAGSADVVTESVIRMNQVVKHIGDWKDKLAAVQAEYASNPYSINAMHGVHQDMLYRK